MKFSVLYFQLHFFLQDYSDEDSDDEEDEGDIKSKRNVAQSIDI